MKTRLFIRWDLQNRWNVRLGFQPDWHPHEGEYRHIEFGLDGGCFELRAKTLFNDGDHCVLDRFVGVAVERFRIETVWVTDQQTGEPARKDRIYIFPVSDVDEKELTMLGERLYEDGGEIELDDGTSLRLRKYVIHVLTNLDPNVDVDHCLVRVTGGGYVPFYTNDPNKKIYVCSHWPEHYTELAVLFSSAPKAHWRSVYALFSVK